MEGVCGRDLFVLIEALAKVAFKVVWAKYFGHPTCGSQIVFQDGFQTVFCLGIAKAIHDFGRCFAVDVRHAPGIAIDSDFAGAKGGGQEEGDNGACDGAKGKGQGVCSR